MQTSLDILQLFKSTYEDRRANLGQYQKNGSFVRPWDFSPLLVFSGLDCFIDRVRTIKVSMETLFFTRKVANNWEISAVLVCGLRWKLNYVKDQTFLYSDTAV